MADDWDLHAVVRGCATPTTTTSCTTTTTSTSSSQNFKNPVSGFSPMFSFPNPSETGNVAENLDELFKPFFPKSQTPISPQSSPISSISYLFGSKEEAKQNQRKQSRPNSISTSNSSRSKKRKNQMKRVCEVPAEGLASDMWSWRKYGQKPIKGSPYPRGYYRCSSSKGCLARKMVEKNRSDPTMYIVTYTAEHNHAAPTHRNSLAGSTRQKPTTSASPATSVDEEVVPRSTRAEESRSEDVVEELEDEEDDDLGMLDMAVSDDFFDGLEGLVDSPVAGDCNSDQFPANFGFPWIANSNAATATSTI